jgi:hypothetical protein
MIRSLAAVTAAVAVAALTGPAVAAPGSIPERGVSVVVQKDKAGDVKKGKAWKGATSSNRRAADLRKATVGDSPRGQKFMRFTWQTKEVQKRQTDVARFYSTVATTAETGKRVVVQIGQVNKFGPEAFVFVDGETSDCLYAKGAPPHAFKTKAGTVSLDIRVSCLKQATDGAIGLELRRATVLLHRERVQEDRVIGVDPLRFKFRPQVNF